MENNNQKKDKEVNCPYCQDSEQIIQSLKEKENDIKKEAYFSKKQKKEKLSRFHFKNIRKFFLLGLIIIAGLIIFYLASLDKNDNQSSLLRDKTKITVFLSPNCTCCHQYISYLKSGGFKVEEKQVRDPFFIKEDYKIPPATESCHTSVIENYFIESHLPIEAIKKLLEEKPNINALSLPEMPSGVPGMAGFKPKNGQFMVYQTVNFLSLLSTKT